LNIGTLWAELK